MNEKIWLVFDWSEWGWYWWWDWCMRLIIVGYDWAQ